MGQLTDRQGMTLADMLAELVENMDPDALERELHAATMLRDVLDAPDTIASEVLEAVVAAVENAIDTRS